MTPNPLYQKDIVTADQFTIGHLTLLVKTAEKMKNLVNARGASDLLKGKIMTALFYEPSSRTFGSFVAAMQRLGGGVIPLQGVTYSSVSKGETLADTVRTFASYSDVIVMRHPDVGSAKVAAEFCPVPLLNAGDGVGEHPTQALLDYYTISRRFSTISDLTITMVGDLLNGRTIHSLSKLLSLHPGVTLNFVSPDILRMPKELINKLKLSGAVVTEQESLESHVSQSDVLYITRVQKERFTDLEIYEEVKHRYVITPTTLRKAKKSAIVMHPFPRVGEITMDVDLDRRSVYITEQMPNGMYVRMALLSLILRP
ncbi:MAG: aspartate carbamoyltransferase [bacterium]|nr:aspartate carbamoyltransferase [bacterium]